MDGTHADTGLADPSGLLPGTPFAETPADFEQRQGWDAKLKLPR